jgi:hypothetical protein
MHLSPILPHSPPISFFLTCSPARTDNEYLHCVKSSSSLLTYPLRPEYIPQHHILEHPQPMSFPQYKRPSFTPIQNKE